jgi:hypothetical protein
MSNVPNTCSQATQGTYEAEVALKEQQLRVKQTMV